MKSIVLLLCFSFLAMQGQAFAACLNGYPSVEQEFYSSRFVVVGHVVSEKPTPESKDYLEGTTYSVAVNEILYGTPDKIISLFSENSSGRFPMKIGVSYLLFIYEGVRLLHVDNCGNSGPVSQSAVALATARALRQ